MLIGVIGLLTYALIVNMWFYEYRVFKGKDRLGELNLIGWKSIPERKK